MAERARLSPGPFFLSRGARNGADFFLGTRSAPAQIPSSVVTRHALLVASLVTEGRNHHYFITHVYLVVPKFIRPF